MKQSIVYALAMVALVGCSATTDTGDKEAGSVVAASEPLLIQDGLGKFDYGDSPTQCVYENLSMHCCPSGYAMDGAQLSNNTFHCSKLANNSGSRFLDKYTQRMGMHACPLGSVMVGFHQGANWLVCQSLPGKAIREDLDSPVGAPGSYLACSLPGAEGGLMSGIHVANENLLCAADANMSAGGGTTSTVNATITVDIGANPPLKGCESTTFLLDGSPMTFLGGELRLDSIYRCKYTAVKSGVSLTQHTIVVSAFNSCQKFTPNGQTVTLYPFTCVP